ncbi:MAG: MBL fold metallo-hydrolase [Pseudomonadota bacterium]
MNSSGPGGLKAGIIPVTPFEQNCTLIWDSDSMKGAVIDPGGDVDNIMAAIEETGVDVETIFLTHGHIDHAGGAEELKSRLKVPIHGPHIDDKELLEGIEQQAQMFGVSGGFRNAYPDKWLEEGDVITIGGHDFDVYHCPGHAPGHVVFVDKYARFAHLGDVLFNGSIGRTDLPGGNHEALIRSIKEKLLPLGDDISFVCGHGPGSTIGQERLNNPFLK